MSPTFPEGPVKPGDKWNSSFHLPAMFKNFSDVKVLGDQNVPFECEYIGTRTEGGRKLAIITIRADAKRQFKSADETYDMAFKIDGEFGYDAETGLMMSTKTMRATTSRGETSTLKTTVKVEPIK